jgi:hypothetical protein
MADEKVAEQLENVNKVIEAAANTSSPVAAVAAQAAAGGGAAKPATSSNNKPTAMSLVGAMAKSWFTQVPLGFGSGFLLAQKNIPGAILTSLLTSLFVSMDILGRKDLETIYWPVLLAMTTVLTLTSVVPWAATLKKPDSRGKQLALPMGVGVAACLCLLAAMVGTNKGGTSSALLGAIITLMYVLISSSIGWHMGKASAAPPSGTAGLHKGWAIYSAIILLLLTLFDAVSQFQ